MPKTITKLLLGKNLKKTTMSKLYSSQDTIVAIATPQGLGAIGVIRISGAETFTILSNIAPKKNWNEVATHTLHLTNIKKEDII